MDIIPSYLPASTSTSISVSDLIQSGRLSSNTQFSLQDEEEECINSSTAAPAGRRAQALSATAAGLDGQKARQRQTMENAARVALCLARAFDKFRTHLNNVAEEKNIIPYSNILLTMLELGDFNIELKDRKRNRMCYDHQNEVPSHDDNDSITAELINTCSRSSHRRCRPIQGAFSSNDHQPNVADVASKSTILSIWTRTDTLLECLLSRLNNPSSSPERQQPSSICDSTPLQVLGKLLYVVFSQGGHYEHSLLSRPEVTNLCQEERDVHSMLVARSSKKRCSESRTLFTSLVESDLFPASICRLLSDMMRATHNNSEDVSSRGSDDDDDYGSHHAPFTSFEGVIQDLEQMVNEPLIFLHNTRSSDTNIGDCDSPISTRLPIFGERYFGRNEEVTRLIEISTNMEARASSKEKEASKEALNAVFVSGVAGSGKSQFVQTVGNFLSEGLGWIVIKSKFERGMEHGSRGIVSSMFDQIIAYLVRMKESGMPSDVAFAKSASKSILDALGGDILSSMVDFLPSIPSLFGGIFNYQKSSGNMTSMQAAEYWNHQCINSLTKILDAVLELDRFIMIVADDLQWADKTSVSLIVDLLVANSTCMSRRCLFVGMYREDEVEDDHPLSLQHSYLQMSNDVKTTEIKIGSLSKNDVVEMIMTQLGLPRRLVLELAAAVHKKTSGHVLFVVQLLNSLLRNSTIAYSTRFHCYSWDHNIIDAIQTGKGVAGFILSNFSSLPLESQHVLQVLSAFGTQIDTQLLQILENYQPGITSSLDSLLDKGILDQAGPLIIFAHDLIQKEIYESMPLAKRQLLHLDMGQLLGKIYQDAPTKGRTFSAGISMTSSTISLACDHIDSAGPQCARDKREKHRYAQWNLIAGEENFCHSNFCAALYYFDQGVVFLDEGDFWSKKKKLCFALHKGAAFAAYALGEAENAIQYAERVIENLSLKDSILVWPVILRSLSMLTKHEECISKGIDVLCRLGFHLPLSPTKESIMDVMTKTDSMVSKFSVDQIGKLSQMDDNDSAHKIMEIMDAFYGSCAQVGSPFLPLAACSSVKYTLEKGVSQESTTGFATFGLFKIYLQGDYSGAKKCADITRVLTEKHKLKNISHMIMYIFIDPWSDPPHELSRKYLKYHDDMMKMGESNYAMIALGNAWRCLIYGGENLSLINQSLRGLTKIFTKHSKYAGEIAALDTILVEELIGVPSSSRSHFDTNVLQAEAESAKNTRLLFRIHFFNLMISYWRGDFADAEESSNAVLMIGPFCKLPSIHLVYYTLFSGLVLFQRYSEEGGDKRLQDGKEMMNQMGTWAKNSMAIFGNKWLLLTAEYTALVDGQCEEAEDCYKKSIEAARGHGIIHELGLAYELLGGYYTIHEREMESLLCIKNAHECYTQWGATSIAKKILDDRGLDPIWISNLDIDSSIFSKELQLKTSKHPREW